MVETALQVPFSVALACARKILLSFSKIIIINVVSTLSYSDSYVDSNSMQKCSTGTDSDGNSDAKLL